MPGTAEADLAALVMAGVFGPLGGQISEGFRRTGLTAPLAPIGPTTRPLRAWLGLRPGSKIKVSSPTSSSPRFRRREALSDSEGASGRRPSRARLAGDLANRLQPPAGTARHPARAIDLPIERRATLTLPKQDRRLRSSPRSRLRPQTDNLTPAISISRLLDQAHLVGEPNPKCVRTFF